MALKFNLCYFRAEKQIRKIMINIFRQFHFYAALTLILLPMCGCEMPNQFSPHHDKAGQLTRDDFFKMTQEGDEPPAEMEQAPAIPKAPKISKFASAPVSLSVTPKVPLQQVFFELGQQAHLSVEINPNVQGGVLFSARQKPLIHVLDRLSDLSGLRYVLEEDVLRVEKDTPYVKNYDVHYLAISRKSQSRISIATDVFKSVGDQKGHMDNGSNSVVTGDSSVDFWEEIDQALISLLQISSDTAVKPFSLNKQAGIVSITGTQKQHKNAELLLSKFRKNAQEQVLVEAKIVEVTLSDQYKSGINWQTLFKGNTNTQGGFGNLTSPTPFTGSVPSINDFFSLNLVGKNLTALVSFISQFGTVRTLSSPRMTVMNNQSAVLKVAENQVFFQVEFDRPISIAQNINSSSNTTLVKDIVSARSQIQTVPIGLVMSMQPSINSQTGEVMMTLRPTISRVTNSVQDPAVTLASDRNVVSTVPVVEVREFDSILKLKSGQVGILGGLMQERSKNDSSGIPGFEKVPFLRGLTKSRSDNHTVTELVIFLKATIVGGNSVHGADRKLYKSFTKDPRPLKI